jgi:NAD(P)-dependent dehydrogenase (short-subunit alcohol dehydrogenase family)
MKHALILGGTRGIGRGLAERCLARGMSVTVCGRDVEALQGSAIATHPALRAIALDIADAAAVRNAVMQAGAPEGSLDLLAVTAGLYFNTRTHPLDEAATLQLLRTNVSGLAHALEAGATRMLSQGHGRIAAISSMAGLLKDYRGASVYGATKRSVLGLCATYRKALAPFGVTVTAVIPGYVDTEKLRELNGGDARHKPFLMPEEEAVTRILQAIDAGQPVCAFPWQMRAIVALLNLVPRLSKVPDFPAPPQRADKR